MMSLIRSLAPVVFGFAVLFAAVPPAIAESGSDREDVVECEGVTNKDWGLSLGGTILGAALMAFVGLQTVSRSLASSGYKQDSSNLAGIGFGVMLGGGLGAGVMAARTCGVATAPGYIGISLALLGLVVLLFSVATGKK